jgi:hypothetical protein
VRYGRLQQLGKGAAVFGKKKDILMHGVSARAALTQAEFDAQKAKILGET